MAICASCHQQAETYLSRWQRFHGRLGEKMSRITGTPPTQTPTESAIAADLSVRVARARMRTVDIVKGIAIVLMVAGHTEQGAMHRHWWDGMPGVMQGMGFFDSFIYSFHMPSFFLISGLFLAGSMERRGARGVVAERLKTIMYPYLLWGLIAGLTGPLTAPFRSVVTPFTWNGLLEGLVSGSASWFLPTLFVCQLLGLATMRMPHWMRLLLALAASALTPALGPTVVRAPMQYFVFLAAGMWVGTAGLKRLEALPRGAALGGFTVLVAVQVTVIGLWGAVNSADKGVVGIAGSAMLLLLARGIEGTAGDRVCSWLGEASLGIFLLSPYGQGGGRELVLRLLHTTAPWPQMVVPIALAVVIPALIWHARERLHLELIFRWP